MKAWSQRFVGAWFGAVITAAGYGTWKVIAVKISDFPFAMGAGNLFAMWALPVLTVAILWLPLLILATILDRRSKVTQE